MKGHKGVSPSHSPRNISPAHSPRKISPSHSPKNSFTHTNTESSLDFAANVSSLAPRPKKFQRAATDPPSIPPKPVELTKNINDGSNFSDNSYDSSDMELNDEFSVVKTLEYMKAEYDHPKGKEEELELLENDIVCLLERTSEDWYYVTKDGENCGFVAASFLTEYTGDPPEHLKIIVYSVDNDSNCSDSESQKSPRDGTNSFDRDHKSSKVKTRIRASGSKFLKRRKRKSTSSSRSNSTNITIQRQDTHPEFKPTKTTRHVEQQINQGSVQPEMKRGKIVEEIVFTEDHYVHILSTLTNVSSKFSFFYPTF